MQCKLYSPEYLARPMPGAKQNQFRAYKSHPRPRTCPLVPFLYVTFPPKMVIRQTKYLLTIYSSQIPYLHLLANNHF